MTSFGGLQIIPNTLYHKSRKDATRTAVKHMDERYRYTYESPLGQMIMTGTSDALLGLWFDDKGGTRAAAEARQGLTKDLALYEEKKTALFERTAEWLDIYFSGEHPGPAPAVCFEDTPFRMEVWEIIRTIPYGDTMSYGEIAGFIARTRGIPRMAAQAVGGAVGANPVSIIVPCHRVVASHGKLGGYGGREDRKIALLKLEGIELPGIF